jgi:hypothetical protein
MEDESPKRERVIEYRVPMDGLPKVYANNVQMSTTSFDVRILFGQIGDLTEDKVAIEQQVQVTMSWLEAKIFADFLWANIEAFEELNGPMKLPKNLTKIVTPETFVLPKKEGSSEVQ